MMSDIFTVEWCQSVFPPERTNEFFDALFGDPDEGAYDIKLSYVGENKNKLEFSFDLHQRGEQCLACNLTYGLPKVFERHPIINSAGLADIIADAAGKKLKMWRLGQTREESTALHRVPFEIWLE